MSFHGRFAAYDEVICRPTPLAGPELPVLVAGPSVAAARRAGRFGDGYLCAWPDADVSGAHRIAAMRKPRRSGSAGTPTVSR